MEPAIVLQQGAEGGGGGRGGHVPAAALAVEVALGGQEEGHDADDAGNADDPVGPGLPALPPPVVLVGRRRVEVVGVPAGEGGGRAQAAMVRDGVRVRLLQRVGFACRRQRVSKKQKKTRTDSVQRPASRR